MTRIGVNGAAGRMGRTVIETAADREDLEVVVGFDVADVDAVRGVPVVDASDVGTGLAEYEPSVVVDFTLPESTVALADACAEAGVGMTCLNRVQRFYFVPSVVWVEPGATVTWTMQSQCRQRTAAYHPSNDRTRRMPADGEPWASPVFQGGGSFEHTLEEPGVYDAFGLYEERGQVATLLVGRPDLGEEPALAADDSTLPEAARTQLALHHEVVADLLA